MQDEQFEDWVGALPDEALEYLEWLVEEVEYILDDIILEASDYKEANQVIFSIQKK